MISPTVGGTGLISPFYSQWAQVGSVLGAYIPLCHQKETVHTSNTQLKPDRKDEAV